MSTHFLKITLITFLFITSCSFKNKKHNSNIFKNKIDHLLVKNSYNSKNGLKLPYRLFSPKNANQTYLPLVIFLHGRGDRGTDNGARIYHEAGFITNQNSLLSSKMQTSFPCYILIPQCSDKTENEEWAKWIGNTPKTPFNGLTKNGSYQMNPIPSESGAATLELIEKISDSLLIDKNRIYLIGVSMGGFGTWEFTSRKPHLFAAAIPMAGYSDPSQIENIKHIPFWIFHGNKDEWNPVEGSRTMYKLLKEQNADVNYTEYKGINHGETFVKAFNEPDLIPWLFSKTKTN
ncbi:phospholipase [Lutibacter sp. HS1-25]|uniref:carboxylesterase family protein n=1 Tax=Lutibacter sp. HS1-25 TaxID=2485000 RepID=UPI0010132D4B|nr:prolyl oligopeptidase family serine peptidase [Lutibacter sp. HS1-25]RXP64583.1 phospholipase [Lutibacter sp. HS1-25]